ncbi:TetR/AcrR family transcriptional regulator [Chromohalobacter nigrandesensis]|uniref:TetR/AcrR family transcriptional regulator n=1 Tax=Chromohalobacter nigrandesensis TaxID=119863 RepID=UPI001FF42A16|nr:TetR/AcrR family transcriptional regulator [Chromohalobacter nigrandesensis]MCK0746530.1 TetR/AcrR family transcriptional regulator [Chromohalobacter nigrandesensis]
MSSVSSRPGRPRSTSAAPKAMRAALDLALEGGLPHATVERISAVSGVAKSTLYRRWPNAPAIVMDAFFEEVGPMIAYDMQLPIHDNFCQSVGALVEALKGPRGQLLRELLGTAQAEPDLREAFVERWIAPRRRMGQEAIESAIARGELRPEVDPGLALDLIYGAVYYHLTVSFTDIDQRYIAALVDRVLGPYLTART